MQRPIIFVVTADPALETIAMEAILSTRHGMRRARGLDAAGALLAEGTGDIALAIIDLDFDESGLSLLRILGGCEPDFPVLALTSQADDARVAELVSGLAIDWLKKPVTTETLQQEIRTLCRAEKRFDTAPARNMAVAQNAGSGHECLAA